MKKNISIFIVLLFTISIFSIFGEETDPYEGKNYSNASVDVYFRNGTITIDYYNYETKNGELERNVSKYTYHILNKIPFLFFGDRDKKEYLSLSSEDILLLYTKDSIKPIYGGFFSMKPCVLFNNYEIKSASSYSDNQFSFPVDNLSNLNLFHPWVEGVPGYGIGERISFTAEEIKPIVGFYFSNGFVSFEKPYLYTQNARVKKIKVTNENKDFNFVYDIDDTPNLQYFEVKRNTQDLIIEILDVYPGTKWEDTAINFILLDTRDFFGYSSDSDNEK